MQSVFLSHTSIDKPFVEKLAKDLKRIGVNVFFDKWDISIGESITWKIEEGIRAHEYLGIVLSPEALQSEWVKSEISSAWVKQMKTKKISLLPILYRTCDIPLFLADRKYADFRNNYNEGFETLVNTFWIKDIDTLSIENWRIFTNKRKGNWKKFRVQEFENLVTVLIDRSIEYNWSCYVGGSANEFSVQFFPAGEYRNNYVTFKLKGRTNFYWASLKDQYNPNHFRTEDFNICVGSFINACDEFLWRKMEDFKNLHGNPLDKAIYFTHRFSRGNEVMEAALELRNRFNWYKGKNSVILS
jgi:hypothetical protein